MRIPTWQRLAALCLIIGSFSASPEPLSARPPVAEPKKPLVSEEFTGYGTTDLAAQKDALERACAWLKDQSGLDWSPKAEYLRERKMVRFSESEDKEFEEPMGAMKVVKMQLEIGVDQARDIQKQVQQQRMKQRQKYSLLGLIGAVALIGVVGGYLRLEEATKGYYTRLLRFAAVGVLLVVILAGLCVVA